MINKEGVMYNDPLKMMTGYTFYNIDVMKILNCEKIMFSLMTLNSEYKAENQAYFLKTANCHKQKLRMCPCVSSQ